MQVPVRLIPRSEAKGGLTHEEAQESPCLNCSESPCCTYLPVHRFTAEHLLDVDYARYLLNFDGIELGLDGTGEWSVYYHRACRHLSPEDGSCGLHGQPDKPLVCQGYNPYRCWYKRAMTVPAAHDFVRVDHRRMDWYLDRVRYDENRRIIERPDWESVVTVFGELPIEAPLSTDSVGEANRSSRRGKTIPVTVAGPRSYRDVAHSSPCDSCSSFCCTAVEFPMDVPRTVSALDFVRFSLGFPGVEIGVNTDGWRLIVNTTCEHLNGTSCSLFGEAERPIKCASLDAWRCSFRADHDPASQRALARINVERLDTLIELTRVDDDGMIVEMPRVDELFGPATTPSEAESHPAVVVADERRDDFVPAAG